MELPAVPEGATVAYGGVVLDAARRKVLLREPKHHFGGYVWTFAKGRPDPGETAQQTALREVREEMGIEARIVGLLPDWYGGDASVTLFFLMEQVEDLGCTDAETESLRWVPLEEAGQWIAQTSSVKGRARDLAVIAALRARLRP